MKPSFARPELKNQTGNNKTYKSVIGCLDGTVPILRNTKEFNVNSQFFAEKYFHPLLADSPGTHIAGVRSLNGPFHGVEALFDAYNQFIEPDQASYSQIYIGSGLNNQVNFISAGFMINPSFFRDGRIWSYGFWKGKDGKGCYNTACSGFVQVSSEIPIVKPIDNLKPGEPVWWRCSVHQDKNTGNWWITQLIPNAPYKVDIGYWPKELFNLLNNGSNMAGVGGVVQASRSNSSPQMGNGKYPDKRYKNTAIFANIEVLDSNYKQRRWDYFPWEELLDCSKFYRISYGYEAYLYEHTQFGFYFNYGGPGGNTCGI
ncbi:unnamed protein product [Arabis nemorensis]|uniref:Neprosin PEP catalytic domain-containing protein n=1 Tax=Arabis nemorensis TaxID=586526 RepID=A0A565C9L4_9BRAS|nr:unnamed protein product [Arabis nemorensis]